MFYIGVVLKFNQISTNYNETNVQKGCNSFNNDNKVVIRLLRDKQLIITIKAILLEEKR